MERLILALLALLLLDGTAFAQGEERPNEVFSVSYQTSSSHGVELLYSEPPAMQTPDRLLELETKHDSIKLRRPRAWLGVSTILLAGGIAMVSWGATLCSRAGGCDSEPLPVGSRAILGGVLYALPAVVGAGLAGSRLVRRKRERRRLRFEIDSVAAR